MSTFLKKTIVICFYIAAIILCIDGTMAIAGIPLGLVGYALQRYFKVTID